MAVAAVYHFYSLALYCEIDPSALKAAFKVHGCPGFLHLLIETLKGKKTNVLESFRSVTHWRKVDFHLKGLKQINKATS